MAQARILINTYAVMKLDKPLLVPVRHLLGAVGSGVAGFRIGDHIGKRTNPDTGQRETFAGSRRSNPHHPEKIDGFVLDLLARAYREDAAAYTFVRREAIAAHLEVPEHFVDQAFERINKLGILGPAQNGVNPDDVARGVDRSAPGWRTPGGGHVGSGWNGTLRTVDMAKLGAYLENLSSESRPAHDPAAAEVESARAPRRRAKP